MLIPQLILSLVFLVGGLLMAKYPPKKINPLYGYRTRRSMQSPEAWKYAQRISSRRMVMCGLLGILLFIIGWVAEWSEGIQGLLLIVSLAVFIAYLFVSVEGSLKRKFPDLVN